MAPHKEAMDENDEIFVPFAKPSIGDEEISAVVEALKSGWLSSGPKSLQFEANFADYLDIPVVQAVAVNSATAGLHLALEALGITEESSVVLPTMTFTATAEVVKYLGAKIILVDSEPEGPNISLSSLEEFSENFDAVIPVHFGGIPVDIGQLRNIIGDRIIVEDAAHAFPTKLGSQYVGTLNSDACVFSFYANKTITTGEGGMVVSSNSVVTDRIRVMRNHGIDRNVFARFQGTEVNLWEYDIIAAGYKYNLTDPAAALGIVQLARAEVLRNKRKRIATEYTRRFDGLPFDILDHSKPGSESSYHLYTIQLHQELKISRNDFIERLRQCGVMTSVHYKPLHLMSYWQKLLGYDVEMFPNANRRYQSTISLPLFPSMTNLEIEHVVKCVQKVLV